MPTIMLAMLALSVFVALVIRFSAPADRDSWPTTRSKVMKIRIIFTGGRSATATLDDNETSKSFVALLPLRLTLSDFASTEKVSDLPARLSTAGAPPGYEPSAGDVTFYAPWGNLAFFHRNFVYSNGLIRLGRLDSGLEEFKLAGPLRVTVEQVEIAIG
jgi:hypothetical protein